MFVLKLSGIQIQTYIIRRICIKSLNNKVFYPLILILYRDPGSVMIIFTDPDPKARDLADPDLTDPDTHHYNIKAFESVK